MFLRAMTVSSKDMKRLVIWRSRRGMLELDALLCPFARHRYEHLSSAERTSFENLLELDDVQILEYVQRPSRAGEFEEIINEILRYRLLCRSNSG